MYYLGDYPLNSFLHFSWGTTAVAGESITRGTNGNIRIYKNNSVTQRTSAAGITDVEDFDALTGVHMCTVDLGDNTDAGFYVAGNEYHIILEGAVIDGKAINHPLAQFSVQNRIASLDANTAVSRLPTSLIGGRMSSDIGSVTANVQAATNLANGALGLILTQVVSGSTLGNIKTGLTITTNGHYNNRVAIYLSGNNYGQANPINFYNGATGVLVVRYETANIPDVGDRILIA